MAREINLRKETIAAIEEAARKIASEKLAKDNMIPGEVIIESYSLIDKTIGVGGVEADPNVKSEREVREAYERYLLDRVVSLTSEEKREIIKSLLEITWNRIEGTYIPKIVAYIPGYKPTDITYFDKIEVDEICFHYVKEVSEHIGESEDGYRAGGWVNKKVSGDKCLDLTDNEILDEILFNYFSSKTSVEDFMENKGWRYKTNYFMTEWVKWEDILNILSDPFRTEVKEAMREALEPKIKELQKRKERIERALEEYKRLIETDEFKYLMSFKNLSSYAVGVGRDNAPIVKKMGEKIKVFDRRLKKLPEPGKEIYILNKRELERVEIITDWVSCKEINEIKEKYDPIRKRLETYYGLTDPENIIRDTEKRLKNINKELEEIHKRIN